MNAVVPDDERERLAVLLDTDVLDTAPEQDFDEIAALAAELCGTPMGLVSLIDSDRLWVKAKVGVQLDEMPRALARCASAVSPHGLLEVSDATNDPRFADDPLVSGELGCRFFAGAPIVLDHHIIGTVCVFDKVPRELTDTQRRALGNLARHAAAQLELRRHVRRRGEIADRTRQLDWMKDSFLATVSHELRTPLSAIRGYLEVLLEDDVDPDSARRFLTVMQRNSEKLLGLIDQLLLVSRLSEDGARPQLGHVDLAELAHQATAACRTMAEHRDVKLHDHAEGPIVVRGDAKRLRQALDQLVVNAVKFTEPGGDVLISSADLTEPNLVITDTGIGIPAEDIPHLFDRFFRSSTADHMASPGSGLGLAIVRSIIDAHAGTVDIVSEPGVGTTVQLTFPRPR